MKLPESDASSSDEAEMREAAARWVIRQDRQLTDAEAREFEAWLAGDARRAVAYARSVAAWGRVSEISATIRTKSRAPGRRSRHSTWLGYAAIAAVLVFGFIMFQRRMARRDSEAIVAAPTSSVVRYFTDGTVAWLRPGAEITSTFAPAERRVQLLRGEAFFQVAKEPTRPFFVTAGHVTVQAVGTAFSVHAHADAVDVLVTEGTVRVTPPQPRLVVDGGAQSVKESAMVSAGNRASITMAPQAEKQSFVVRAVSAAEIARILAWREPMLELRGATLAELVTTFARRSGRRIEIADPSLRELHIGGRFPPDDVDGFVRALGALYEVKADVRPDGTIILARGKPAY